ncbi:3-dehydroquinate synthase [Desulfovibrio sp. X2]|uniref:3-dehydroquinate synthase n=1 Tax=Desulfovibrio sp. X2 TaxID=941449 RepID=UPI000358D7BE|nr:3-dehydroquinate synthase [Desulfovibrio sp. X2]EPR41084.1 3-dehydroquinate synthase [Desulfovibrio sp. X2]
MDRTNDSMGGRTAAKAAGRGFSGSAAAGPADASGRDAARDMARDNARATDGTVTLRQRIEVSFEFPVVFTRGVFRPGNPALARVLAEGGAGPHRTLAVIDQGLVRARPSIVRDLETFAEDNADLLRLAEPPIVAGGGERVKADEALVDLVLQSVLRGGLCRQSFILAVGGGALLDAVGLAAALAHRGVRLVRLPSTVLGQNDAGVGVKNGVNRFGRKNYEGTFAPPFAVVSDLDFLDLLPERERRAGLSEAVKVALIRDAAFFARLEELRAPLAALDPSALEESVIRCADLHLTHIRTAGDPFEFGSARPLDFGHWSAHALEELTGGELRHGEAVALGLALDSLYCVLAGMLDAASAERILTLLDGLGFALWHPALATLDVERSIESFREHLGGRLQLSLITGIGRRVEVERVDAGLMRRAAGMLAERLRAATDPAAGTTGARL